MNPRVCLPSLILPLLLGAGCCTPCATRTTSSTEVRVSGPVPVVAGDAVPAPTPEQPVLREAVVEEREIRRTVIRATDPEPVTR